MKNFLVCFLIFLFQIAYCQKKYHLDYALEFESINGLKVSKLLFYYNSKDNGIRLFLLNTDSLNYEFIFTDSKNISIKSTIKKDDLVKAKYIQNTCEFLYKYQYPFEKKLKKYSFVNLNDTVISGVSYYHYQAKHKKLKRKDKNVHYIINKKCPDCMLFFHNSTSYELWKKHQNVPNGIPFIIFHKDYYGNIIDQIQLKNYYKIDKYIVIPNDCNLD